MRRAVVRRSTDRSGIRVACCLARVGQAIPARKVNWLLGLSEYEMYHMWALQRYPHAFRLAEHPYFRRITSKQWKWNQTAEQCRAHAQWVSRSAASSNPLTDVRQWPDCPCEVALLREQEVAMLRDHSAVRAIVLETPKKHKLGNATVMTREY